MLVQAWQTLTFQADFVGMLNASPRLSMIDDM